jgi:hypothetical protein
MMQVNNSQPGRYNTNVNMTNARNNTYVNMTKDIVLAAEAPASPANNNLNSKSHEELVEYSRLFGTDHLPIIFKGKLSDKQLQVIEVFLNTSEKDLKYVFGEVQFAYFFYKILNPLLKKNSSDFF